MTNAETAWPQASERDEDKRYFATRARWHEDRAEVAIDSSTRTLHLRLPECTIPAHSSILVHSAQEFRFKYQEPSSLDGVYASRSDIGMRAF